MAKKNHVGRMERPARSDLPDGRSVMGQDHLMHLHPEETAWPTIQYGFNDFTIDAPAVRFITAESLSARPSLPDVGAAVSRALEAPSQYPALRRALTPDDHVAIVVDDQLPHVDALVSSIVEHILQADVVLGSISVIVPPDAETEWALGIPESLRPRRLEVHDPSDRRRLSYLATTTTGRRVYLNRSVVDADQIVVLSERRYDPLLGYSGSEGALFPSLSDEVTRHEFLGQLRDAVPGKQPWPARRESMEVAWLLGAPFMVQAIPGDGDNLAYILGGPTGSSRQGEDLLNATWRVTVPELADTVIAAIGGNPAGHRFADLSRALASASRVVKPDGRIVLLSEATPALGPGEQILRDSDSPQQALKRLRSETPTDSVAAFLWATAVQRASVYLLSGMEPDVAEEMFATPLESIEQIYRLLERGTTCLLLKEAHKTLALHRQPS